MNFSKVGNFLVVIFIVAVLFAGIFFAFEKELSSQKAVASNVQGGATVLSIETDVNDNAIPLPPPGQKLANPPEIVKAVYVTGYSAGAKSYVNYLSNLFKNTEINTVVIDIKGSDGYVSYNSRAEDVQKYKLTNNMIADMDGLIKFLHDQNVYVVGRIAVFEDPQYAKARPELAIYNKEKTTDLAKPVLWRDNNNLAWLDPASRDVWDYDISLAKEALYRGFDEINFDYIRFPTDGNTKNMGFPVYDEKTPIEKVIRSFFEYLRASLPGEKISADLFGLVTVNTDDMGIGQVLEDALENFDYVCPMVYPSHYANGFISFANPAEHPYEIIKYSLDSAKIRSKAILLRREDAKKTKAESVDSPASTLGGLPGETDTPLAKIRPWLQDFNMGAFYTADMIKKEIKATQDSLGQDYAGFMLWNPSNIYTQGAVAK